MMRKPQAKEVHINSVRTIMRIKRIASTAILMLITAAGSLLLSSCTASQLPDAALPQNLTSAAARSAADDATSNTLGEKVLTAATLVPAEELATVTLQPDADAAYDVVPEEEPEPEPETSVAEESLRRETDSQTNDESPTEEAAPETTGASTAAADYKLADIRSKLSRYSSVSFSIDSDSSFVLNYDSHKIPITVNADGSLQFLPDTGEMKLSGQVTMATSGQKKVIPIGFFILEEEGRYVRYVMQEDENWIREEVADQKMIYFHPEYLKRYDNAAFGMLPDHAIADPASALYELRIESDFLAPLLSPVNTAEVQTESLTARMVLNTDQALPMTVSLDTDEYIGQMIIDSYQRETTAVTLEVLEGRTTLSNFRFGEADRIELPEQVTYTLEAGTTLPEPAGPNGDSEHTGNTWEPAETGSDPLTQEEASASAEMNFPEPIDQAMWDRLGAPIINEETGIAAISDDDIVSLLGGITIQVTERQSSEGTMLLQPIVVNETDYIVEHLSVIYDFKGEDLKVNTHVSALLPGQHSEARILDGGLIQPAMVQDGQLKESAVQNLIVYLIDREENIVMLSANRRDDGSLAFSATGGVLTLVDSTISFASLVPESAGLRDEKLGTFPASITNGAGITFKQYSLLYKNLAEGRWGQLKLDDPLGPDETAEGLQIAAGTARRMEELQPLTLTLQVGSDTYNYDFVLGRLIRTNY